MLDSTPLFSAILGTMLLFVLFSNKSALGSNKPAWRTLILIILLAIHTQVDAYLYFTGVDYGWVGLSFLHFPLMGGLFLLFASQLTRIQVNLKLWGLMLAIYTVIRVLILIPEDTTAYENYSDEISWTDIGIMFDSLVSNALNIAGLALAFIKIKRLDFVVKPNPKEELNLKLLSGLLVLQMGLYVASVGINITTFFYADQWLIFWKIESMVSGFFFFVLAFYAIRFPIFSVYGDFEDLGAKEKKYANSSLDSEDSNHIWTEISRLMEEEKLYLNAEYRLNDLAQRVGKSIHHVSQAINQHRGDSFSDFLNAYRVEAAKTLLSSDQAQRFTILAIAHESGFNSKTAFYNAFKKFEGKTPSQFMKEQA